MRQIDADKAATGLAIIGLAIINSILAPFVRQTEAPGGAIRPLHEIQVDRWATVAVLRQKGRHKRRPRRCGFDLNQKAVSRVNFFLLDTRHPKSPIASQVSRGGAPLFDSL